MMETFIVLGLCFILYEALDFFQGCMHSSSPPSTDQIEAYRRQLDEQRAVQHQEQFLANLTPLLGVLASNNSTSSAATTPTASTASVISDLRAALGASAAGDEANYAASTPALNGGISGIGGGFRPAHRSIYESQQLHGTSSLPRDYYYLQQQQLKNKNSSRSLISKFSNSSDNRIFPEATSVLGVPAGVITTQPGLSVSNTVFDCQPPIVSATPLVVDLKRAILKNSNNNEQDQRIAQNNLKNKNSPSPAHNLHAALNSAESDSEDSASSSESSADSASAGSASGSASDQEAVDEREFASGSCSSSHADFREIECERLRRKCVSVKRIYSISEKF